MEMTAIDKLFEELWNTSKDKFVWESIRKKAKELEKQQIIDAYATVITKYNGVKSWTKIYDEEAEQYYSETYLNNQPKTDK